MANKKMNEMPVTRSQRKRKIFHGVLISEMLRNHTWSKSNFAFLDKYSAYWITKEKTNCQLPVKQYN